MFVGKFFFQDAKQTGKGDSLVYFIVDTEHGTFTTKFLAEMNWKSNFSIQVILGDVFPDDFQVNIVSPGIARTT